MDRMIRQVAMLTIALLTAGHAFGQSSGAEERVSVTKQMPRAERDAGVVGEAREDRYAGLETAAGPDKSAGPRSKTAAAASAPGTEFWFYDADVILFNDDDRDGYFHGIDLLFDADTVWDYAEVYAVAYLSLNGGPWNEYAATDDFVLTGAIADDEYVIVTELVSGYPTGSYDLLIELFDAATGEFLASFGPEDSSALSFLSLEDAGRDVPGGTTTVVVTERGGGSLGWPVLLMLACAAIFTGRRRMAPALD
ncbi:MAG: choice-of-anchor H family protein [Woeseiaceae bacterium]|nr:choice-of-anchor H family protein [Woeseiaceae bacterium]